MLILERSFPNIFSSGASWNRNGNCEGGSVITILVGFSCFHPRLHSKDIWYYQWEKIRTSVSFNTWKIWGFILCSMYKSRVCPLCEITEMWDNKMKQNMTLKLRDEQRIFHLFNWEMFLFRVHFETILKDNERSLQLKH